MCSPQKKNAKWRQRYFQFFLLDFLMIQLKACAIIWRDFLARELRKTITVLPEYFKAKAIFGQVTFIKIQIWLLFYSNHTVLLKKDCFPLDKVIDAIMMIKLSYKDIRIQKEVHALSIFLSAYKTNNDWMFLVSLN